MQPIQKNEMKNVQKPIKRSRSEPTNFEKKNTEKPKPLQPIQKKTIDEVLRDRQILNIEINDNNWDEDPCRSQ